MKNTNKLKILPLTMYSKAYSTLVVSAAEVSINAIFFSYANFEATSIETVL